VQQLSQWHDEHRASPFATAKAYVLAWLMWCPHLQRFMLGQAALVERLRRCSPCETSHQAAQFSSHAMLQHIEPRWERVSSKSSMMPFVVGCERRERY
jgi:hypothetical protein